MANKLNLVDMKPAATIEIDLDKKCVLCGQSGGCKSGFCLNCVGDSLTLKAPMPFDFRSEDGREIDYLLAPELATIGRKLIRTYEDDFDTLVHAEIDYFWKREGGVKAGQNTLGKCVKVSGELKYYSQKDFIIWVAADHCIQFELYELTALVFHELKHAHFKVGEKKGMLVGHDFEGFAREIEIFGSWRNNARVMAEAFKNARELELFK